MRKKEERKEKKPTHPANISTARSTAVCTECTNGKYIKYVPNGDGEVLNMYCWKYVGGREVKPRCCFFLCPRDSYICTYVLHAAANVSTAQSTAGVSYAKKDVHKKNQPLPVKRAGIVCKSCFCLSLCRVSLL
jgi:hypothetical protein